MRLSLTLAVACLALTACASAADSTPKPKGAEKYKDDPRLGEQVDKVCFASNIDSFGDNTRDTFTVREGFDHYLIEVFGSCVPLQHAMTIRMLPKTSCLRKGDNVVVSDTLLGGAAEGAFTSQRCMVDKIYKWDPKAKDKAPDTEDSSTPAQDS